MNDLYPQKEKLSNMVHLINVFLILAQVIFSFMVWDALPEAIPVHYGAGGLPNRWVIKNLFDWYLLPMVGIFMTSVLYLSYIAVIKPENWNIVKKEDYLKLPEEKRQRFVKEFKEIIGGMGSKMAVLINAFLLYAQISNYMVATRIWKKINIYPSFILIAVIIIMTVVFIINIRKWSKELIPGNIQK